MIRKLKQFVVKCLMGIDYGFSGIGVYRVVRKDNGYINSFWITVSVGILGTRIVFNETTRIHLKKPFYNKNAVLKLPITYVDVLGGTTLYFDENLFPAGNLKCGLGRKRLKQVIENIGRSKQVSRYHDAYSISKKVLNDVSK